MTTITSTRPRRLPWVKRIHPTASIVKEMWETLHEHKISDTWCEEYIVDWCFWTQGDFEEDWEDNDNRLMDTINDNIVNGAISKFPMWRLECSKIVWFKYALNPLPYTTIPSLWEGL